MSFIILVIWCLTNYCNYTPSNNEGHQHGKTCYVCAWSLFNWAVKFGIKFPSFTWMQIISQWARGKIQTIIGPWQLFLIVIKLSGIMYDVVYLSLHLFTSTGYDDYRREEILTFLGEMYIQELKPLSRADTSRTEFDNVVKNSTQNHYWQSIKQFNHKPI